MLSKAKALGNRLMLGVPLSMVGLAVAMSVHAQEVSQADIDAAVASSSAAVKATGNATKGVFFGTFPWIFLVYVSIGIVIWGAFLAARKITGGKK